MSGDEHARDMYRFVYEGVADGWGEIVELHKAAIRARLGEIDDAVERGGIVDWLFGMFGSAQGEGRPVMNAGLAYTVKHIQKGLTRMPLT